MFTLSKLPKRNILSKANYTQILTEKIKAITAKNYSTKVAVRDDITNKELARTIERISSIKPKHYKKKPQKPPFAKNLFLGVFDTDILAYPEALDKQMVDLLEKDIIPIKDFFENVDDKREKRITKNYLANLSKLKLIGLQASIFNGGRQLTLTETCRYLEELAANSSRIGVVDSEMLGIQMLIKFGTKDQQEKYLNRIMNGEVMVSFCAAEINTSNSQLFQTKAVFSSEQNAWILNGVKKSIVNGSTADIFIVLAESEKVNRERLPESVVNAFIVERGNGGITSTPCEVSGLDETDISNVAFENTAVPAENLIGEVGTGTKIISSILTEYRISKGAVLTTLLKNATNNFVQRCLKMDGGSNNLINADAVKFKIGELVTALYAIESTTYLTAGLFDQYENQDCELEAAIVKFISAQYCRDSISEFMNFMGSATYLRNDECNRLYRDCLGHLLLNEPVDSLKLTIALLGLQHAGKSLASTIKVLRNPFFNPSIILKRIWTQKRHIEDNPRLTLRLHEYLHPSCVHAAEFLEYAVFRLQFATETLLSRHGPEIVNKHLQLSYLSECITDIYVMTAVLARASRSYCIGLKHADVEMDIAMAFVSKAVERVRNNVKKIWNGPYNTADEKYLKVGEVAIGQKEYFPPHPLTRNY